MDGDDTGTAGNEVRGGPIEQIEGSAKRFVLAGIGAVAAACDTAEEQYDRFVNRGQKVQDEWQQRADDVRRQNAGARTRFGDFVRGAMDSFLNSVNVPSKGDIDTINAKLNILNRKMDDIQLDRVRESGSGPAAPEPPPPPPPPADTAT